MSDIKIIDYREEHQPYFEAFNRAWIEELFEMEPVDTWVVTNPDKSILEPGGAILMAEYKGVPAGTVGLRKVDDDTYEFTKMAVDANYRRLGIAEAISYASFRKAKELGAKHVILYSNKLNAAAIKLYEKLGFKHLEVEPGVYKRANVKMIIDVDTAISAADKYDAESKKKSTITIIRADTSHAWLIAGIGKKSFSDSFGHLFTNKNELAEYIQQTYDPLKLFKSLFKKNNTYFLAMMNGEPIGFAKVKNHSRNDKIDALSQMELQKIYVLPGCQGYGAGSALLTAVKALASEVQPDFLWLDTHVSNEKAVRLYEKNGFVKTGKHFFTIGTQPFEYHVLAMPVKKINRIKGEKIFTKNLNRTVWN